MSSETIMQDRRRDSRERSYPGKADPNRPAPRPRGRGASPSAQGESRPYPEKCRPQGGRSPLTEEQQELATRYLCLAQALARRVRTRAAEREELEAAAYLALVEAAQSFDPSRNVKFSTYAHYRIAGALSDCQRFRIGGGRQGTDGRVPVFQRLASRDELHGWVIGKEPRPPLGAELEEDEVAESYLQRLPQSYAQACRLIYVDGWTQDEAAGQLGWSKSYVCRLHRNALEWLREEDRAARARPVQAARVSSN